MQLLLLQYEQTDDTDLLETNTAAFLLSGSSYRTLCTKKNTPFEAHASAALLLLTRP